MSADALLMIVATPIGNLGDLSPRAEEALRAADAIACEDTRHTRKLLSAKDITGKRLLAVHEHNERNAAAGIIALLQAGKRVALVTDAGTPGISDPGARVIRAALDAGHEVTHLPGPSALVVALVMSGLPAERFVFEGFLPRKGRERADRIAALRTEMRTVVLYEAPGRVRATLAEIAEVVGDERQVAVCRELTKRFESVWRGAIGVAADRVAAPGSAGGDDDGPLGTEIGEYVLVLDGAHDGQGGPSDDALRAALLGELSADVTLRDAVDTVSAVTGAAHRRVYRLALELRGR